MLINSGMRVSSMSSKPVALTKGDINGIRSIMPQNFRIGRIFELSGKTVIIQKGLLPELADAVASALKSGVIMLSRMPEQKICFVGHDIDPRSEVELRFDSRVVKFPQQCCALDAKRQVLCELAEFMPQEEDGSLHLLVASSDQRNLSALRSDMVLSVRKKIDPSGYCLQVARNSLSGKYSPEEIERTSALIPVKAVEELNPDQLAGMIEMSLAGSTSRADCLKITRKKDGDGASSVETMFMKDAYFGASHDIVSVFANVGLEPFDMRFYSLGEESGKLFCVCRARFIGRETGIKKTESDIMELLDEDRKQRASLAGEGESLWFSFVGLYNAISRFAASMNVNGQNAQKNLEVMKKHGGIMLSILSVLRKRCDQSYTEESQCIRRNDHGIEEINRILSELPDDEARVMKFCLDFALSVRKTDYFDFNRLKEVSSFLISADQIKGYLDSSAAIRPEEMLYIYRRSHGIEVHPVYASERRTRTERYSNPEEIGQIQDSPMTMMMGPYVRNIKQTAAAKALEIMPSVTDMSDRQLSIFEGMRFIDEDDRECSISGIIPNSYFSITAGALFGRPQEDGLEHQEPTYMEDVARILGLSPQDIDHVSIKFLGKGGLRNISTVKVHSGTATNTFIAAVNRRDVHDSERGHAAEEFEAIKSAGGLTTLLPVPFGFVPVPVHRGNVGVLFKEFLMGLDCEQYLRALSKEKGRRAFFRAVGTSMGQLYAQTGMGSSDSKLSNMVFFRDGVRFCDICPLTDDMGMVKDGFIQLFCEVPGIYKADLVEGILEQGDPGREFMGRIRENMLSDNEDSWQSMTTWEELNEIALSKGIKSEEYYKWKLC